MSDKFWIVVDMEQDEVLFTHSDIDSAIACAEDFANENVGVKFHVFEAVGFAVVKKEPAKFEVL